MVVEAHLVVVPAASAVLGLVASDLGYPVHRLAVLGVAGPGCFLARLAVLGLGFPLSPSKGVRSGAQLRNP